VSPKKQITTYGDSNDKSHPEKHLKCVSEIFHPYRSPGKSEKETRFEHSKIAPYINLRFDICECLNRGFFFTSTLVSEERYGRKILKKIPGVSLDGTFRLSHHTSESAS